MSLLSENKFKLLTRSRGIFNDTAAIQDSIVKLLQKNRNSTTSYSILYFINETQQSLYTAKNN